MPGYWCTTRRGRACAALTSIGLALPPKRIIVNLSPADVLKEGSHFDLPIALGVLVAMEVLPSDAADGYLALGELALDLHRAGKEGRFFLKSWSVVLDAQDPPQ